MNNPWESDDIQIEVARPKLKPPPLYKVVMLNDDYTPMEFVVEVLEKFFAMNNAQAIQVMLAVHKIGNAVCGIFTRELAETKVAVVINYARKNKHPLMCVMRAVNA